MSKSVYVRVFNDLELLRYVFRCAIERQLEFPAGMNKVYCYCIYTLLPGLPTVLLTSQMHNIADAKMAAFTALHFRHSDGEFFFFFFN